jgi:Na+/proline symporter
MQLNTLDWIIVVASLALSFWPVILFARRAGSGTTEFFASGRAAPWWLIGTSMVATTFSTDTPNLVTDFVRSHGVSYNWMWWAFALTSMLTVFFYARLWRRAGVLTDLEFYELRYSGRSAAFLRGFRAIYLGLIFNCSVMAAVTLGAAKIANALLGWDRLQTVIICGAICIAFGAFSGLWGVLATDFIQFAFAMFGAFAAAWFALQQPEVGGLTGLVASLDARTLRLIPDLADTETTLAVLVLPLAVQWWAMWYPGAEPGGGSYIAQRMLAARDERHALGGTLWFSVAHYALRPWPWILVALASLRVFPELADLQRRLPHLSPEMIGNDLAYPAMLTLVPHGALGVVMASLLAAYVSTITTHTNWGTSYLVMDFYRRFLRPASTEPHLVWVSRATSALLMVLAGALTFLLSTAGEAFNLLLSIGAGTGLIYLLRWFWWRINAWSEIAAMAASLLMAVALFIGRKQGFEISSAASLLISVAATTLVWLVVTLLTPPVEASRLEAFCRRVQPAGPGWANVRARAGIAPSEDNVQHMFLGWVLGCALIYSALLGTGMFLYGRLVPAVAFTAAFAASAIGLYYVLARLLRHR